MHRIAIATFFFGAALAAAAVWTFFPRTVTVLKEAQHAHGWKPTICATGLSLDSPPLPVAVCSDVYYPVYSFRRNDVPHGYLGLLRGCQVLGGIYGCQRATIDKL